MNNVTEELKNRENKVQEEMVNDSRVCIDVSISMDDVMSHLCIVTEDLKGYESVDIE